MEVFGTVTAHLSNVAKRALGEELEDFLIAVETRAQVSINFSRGTYGFSGTFNQIEHARKMLQEHLFHLGHHVHSRFEDRSEKNSQFTSLPVSQNFSVGVTKDMEYDISFASGCSDECNFSRPKHVGAAHDESVDEVDSEDPASLSSSFDEEYRKVVQEAGNMLKISKVNQVEKNDSSEDDSSNEAGAQRMKLKSKGVHRDVDIYGAAAETGRVVEGEDELKRRPNVGQSQGKVNEKFERNEKNHKIKGYAYKSEKAGMDGIEGKPAIESEDSDEERSQTAIDLENGRKDFAAVGKVANTQSDKGLGDVECFVDSDILEFMMKVKASDLKFIEETFNVTILCSAGDSCVVIRPRQFSTEEKMKMAEESFIGLHMKILQNSVTEGITMPENCYPDQVSSALDQIRQIYVDVLANFIPKRRSVIFIGERQVAAEAKQEFMALVGIPSRSTFVKSRTFVSSAMASAMAAGPFDPGLGACGGVGNVKPKDTDPNADFVSKPGLGRGKRLLNIIANQQNPQQNKGYMTNNQQQGRAEVYKKPGQFADGDNAEEQDQQGLHNTVSAAIHSEVTPGEVIEIKSTSSEESFEDAVRVIEGSEEQRLTDTSKGFDDISSESHLRNQMETSKGKMTRSPVGHVYDSLDDTDEEEVQDQKDTQIKEVFCENTDSQRDAPKQVVHPLESGNLQKAIKFASENSPQPAGTFSKMVDSKNSLKGHAKEGTIIITYDFYTGNEGPLHPSPGKKFAGTYFMAYLPANDVGSLVACLLQKAFESGLLFTIVSVEKADVIQWRGTVEHKTQSEDYPDPTYLERALSQLAAMGITPEILQ